MIIYEATKTKFINECDLGIIANEIVKNLKALDDLWHIFCIPHPYIHDGNMEVCLISLGEEVEKNIKEIMKAAISENRRLLKQRLEEL